MPGQVTLLAVGDVAPRVTEPETQLDGIAPVLRAGDIAFGQLETPLTNEGTRQLFPGFRAASGTVTRDPGKTAGLLADAGFTVLSFAGNHTMDRSAPAMLDSVAAAEARGIKIVGAGENLAAARRPAIVEAGGTRVGFLGYCSVLPRGYDATAARPGVAPLRARTFYEQVDWQPGTPPRIVTQTDAADLAALRDDVRRLRERADVVVVSMHWGIHFEPGTIAGYQYEAGHAAVDAGADVILGHHGHVIKGIEFYRGKPVFYSLGNVTLLPRGANGEPLTEGDPLTSRRVDAQLTMIAKLTIEGGRVTRVALIPCWLDLRLRPEVIPPGDPRFGEFLAYLRRVNDIPSTPRNPWEIMYLPPADESRALRDTRFAADGGEIVATRQPGGLT